MFNKLWDQISNNNIANTTKMTMKAKDVILFFANKSQE